MGSVWPSRSTTRVCERKLYAPAYVGKRWIYAVRRTGGSRDAGRSWGAKNGFGWRCGRPARRASTAGPSKPAVMEPLEGEVVVDGAVGRFYRCPEGSLDLCEDGIVFWEGSEVFGSVVAGEFPAGGLVQSDADIPVGVAWGGWGRLFG